MKGLLSTGPTPPSFIEVGMCLDVVEFICLICVIGVIDVIGVMCMIVAIVVIDVIQFCKDP